MLKNILVPLTGFENDVRALEAAFVVGWPLDANIEGFHVQPEPMTIIAAAALRQFGSTMGNRELIHSLEKEAVSRTQFAKAHFDAFWTRHFSAHAFAMSASGANASWSQMEGHPVQDTIAEARLNDFVVLARAAEHEQFSADAIGNILVGSGRPLLLVPDGELTAIGSTIAIAWKEKAESARAVSAAMPLLARAKKVLVLTMDEESSDTKRSAETAGRLAKRLARPGLAVEAHGLAAAPHMGQRALMDKAVELGADLVVAGAYSHSRVRELVFGGFTREMLKACALPILMLH